MFLIIIKKSTDVLLLVHIVSIQVQTKNNFIQVVRKIFKVDKLTCKLI